VSGLQLGFFFFRTKSVPLTSPRFAHPPFCPSFRRPPPPLVVVRNGSRFSRHFYDCSPLSSVSFAFCSPSTYPNTPGAALHISVVEQAYASCGAPRTQGEMIWGVEVFGLHYVVFGVILFFVFEKIQLVILAKQCQWTNHACPFIFLLILFRVPFPEMVDFRIFLFPAPVLFVYNCLLTPQFLVVSCFTLFFALVLSLRPFANLFIRLVLKDALHPLLFGRLFFPPRFECLSGVYGGVHPPPPPRRPQGNPIHDRSTFCGF